MALCTQQTKIFTFRGLLIDDMVSEKTAWYGRYFDTVVEELELRRLYLRDVNININMWRLDSPFVSEWSDLKLFCPILKAFWSFQNSWDSAVMCTASWVTESKLSCAGASLIRSVLTAGAHTQEHCRERYLLPWLCLPPRILGGAEADGAHFVPVQKLSAPYFQFELPVGVYVCMFALLICLYIIYGKWEIKYPESFEVKPPCLLVFLKGQQEETLNICALWDRKTSSCLWNFLPL